MGAEAITFIIFLFPLIALHLLYVTKFEIKRSLFLITLGLPTFILFLVGLGKYYIYWPQFFTRYNPQILNANFLEIIFLLLGIAAIAFYIFIFLKQIPFLLKISAIVATSVFLFISAEQATQITVVDEGNILYEAAILEDTKLEHWRRSAYRRGFSRFSNYGS